MTARLSRRLRGAVQGGPHLGVDDAVVGQVQEQGRSFSCIAEDRSGATYTILVTLRDDQGNLDWEVTEGM